MWALFLKDSLCGKCIVLTATGITLNYILVTQKTKPALTLHKEGVGLPRNRPPLSEALG